MQEAAPSPKRATQQRPMPPFVTGSLTVSKQAIGNIYDGRYNRSRLLKPSHAAQDKFIPCDAEEGECAWLPVTKDQSYSRAPDSIQHARDGAEFQAALGLDGPDPSQWITVGSMESPMGWKSSTTAAYLYDQMS